MSEENQDKPRIVEIPPENPAVMITIINTAKQEPVNIPPENPAVMIDVIKGTGPDTSKTHFFGKELKKA